MVYHGFVVTHIDALKVSGFDLMMLYLLTINTHGVKQLQGLNYRSYGLHLTRCVGASPGRHDQDHWTTA